MAERKALDLDLDALAPREVEITFQGEVIKVAPLKVEHYAKIITSGSALSKITEDANPEELTAAYGKIRELVSEVIPELKDIDLSIPQLTAVYTLLAQMATPEDKALAELNARGVTPHEDEAGDKSPKA